MPVYGNVVTRSEYHPRADVVGDVEITPSGNVVLRAGTEVGGGAGWEQRLHIVLTPTETRQLIKELTRAAGDGELIQQVLAKG